MKRDRGGTQDEGTESSEAKQLDHVDKGGTVGSVRGASGTIFISLR